MIEEDKDTEQILALNKNRTATIADRNSNELDLIKKSASDKWKDLGGIRKSLKLPPTGQTGFSSSEEEISHIKLDTEDKYRDSEDDDNGRYIFDSGSDGELASGDGLYDLED